MRTPTPRDQAYAWHTNALKGVYGDPIIYDETPQAGWYKRRLVKGGPFVPARIWIDAEVDEETGDLLSEETVQCEVNGRYADATDQWQWLCQNPITEAEFNYMTARLAYAQVHEPGDPIADVRNPIDWLRVPLPSPINRRTEP